MIITIFMQKKFSFVREEFERFAGRTSIIAARNRTKPNNYAPKNEILNDGYKKIETQTSGQSGHIPTPEWIIPRTYRSSEKFECRRHSFARMCFIVL